TRCYRDCSSDVCSSYLRVRYHALGKTTLGAPLVALVLSSPQNLKRLDYFRRLNARLADPRTARTTRETQEALQRGRTIVLITSRSAERRGGDEVRYRVV